MALRILPAVLILSLLSTGSLYAQDTAYPTRSITLGEFEDLVSSGAEEAVISRAYLLYRVRFWIDAFRDNHYPNGEPKPEDKHHIELYRADIMEAEYFEICPDGEMVPDVSHLDMLHISLERYARKYGEDASLDQTFHNHISAIISLIETGDEEDPRYAPNRNWTDVNCSERNFYK